MPGPTRRPRWNRRCGSRGGPPAESRVRVRTRGGGHVEDGDPRSAAAPPRTSMLRCPTVSLFLAAIVAAQAPAPAVAAKQDRLLVLNKDEASASLFDPATLKETALV